MRALKSMILRALGLQCRHCGARYRYVMVDGVPAPVCHDGDAS